MSLSRRDGRFGQDDEPLTEFERALQRRLFGTSQDFPSEFTSWLKRQSEIDPPRLLPTNVDRVYNHPRVRVYHSTTQSVSTATLTAITFDSERYDSWAMHDTATNATRLTAPRAGVYHVGGSFEFTSSVSGRRIVFVQVNGTTRIVQDDRMAITTGVAQNVSTSTVWAFNTGDYAELYAYQDSGSTLTIDAAGAYSPEFHMTFLADYPPS